jgi:uncharacterized protein YndB with AHSA1/START domain
MTAMTTLPHKLDRTIVIEARPEVVFSFFTDSERWASWWGAGSTIEPRPAGRVLIRYPGGIEVAGEVLEIVSPERIVFTYGFTSGTPIPPGSSRVTIRLEPVPLGTRLRLSHEFADAGVRDEHAQGWRHQLSVFANVVTDLLHRNAPELVDGWFALWSETDSAARERMLAAIASPGIRFRDRFSLLDGIADVLPHIAASQRFMPNVRLRRTGDVRHCQGVLLADWIASASDGTERGTGTNVFTLGADNLILDVTGFWNLPKGQ